MPMVVSQVYYYWYKHGKGLIFICLQNVEEIIVLKEAHCSISDLQVDTSDTSYDSLEEPWNQVFNFINFTYLKDFLKLSQEKSLLNAICEGPIFEKTIKKRDGESSVLS
jgi:hypothetical protein